MRESLKYLVATTILLLFIGCGFDTNKKLIGKYHLIATDTREQLSLSYDLKDGNYAGVIDETVFAAGYNDKYIIVKQHPHKFEEVEINKKITNYFIVPVAVTNEFWVENEVIGPLSEQQFEQKRHELNLDSVDFSIVYHDLE